MKLCIRVAQDLESVRGIVAVLLWLTLRQRFSVQPRDEPVKGSKHRESSLRGLDHDQA